MNWWSRLFRQKQMEDDLAKELRFHLDEHASDLMERGDTPGQAQREARLALGRPEQVKEKCRDARGTRWLEDAAQDTRYALRSFRQNPSFTAVTLTILALAIGATTVMYAVVDGVLLRPLAFPDSDRLLAVHGSTEQLGEFWGFSNPDFLDVKRESRSLIIAGWRYGGGTISAPGEPEYVEGRQISAGLFTALGVAPFRGRAFLPNEDRPGAAPVAIISFALWQSHFGGDPSAIGRTLIFDGRTYSVIGIASAGVQLSGDADVLTPIGQNTEPRMENRAARFIRVVGRLQTGVSPAEAQAELALIGRRLAQQYPNSNGGLTIRAHPLQEEMVRDVRATLWLLLSAVCSVLLIACVNLASLFLTRSISREHEFAMRAALGAGWGRLARQCLTESAMLGVCGGLLGTFIAKISVRPFVALWPGNLPRAEEIRLDWRVFAFGMGVSLLCALFFGLVPALRVPLHNLEAVLRARGRIPGGSSHRLYGPFVIAEISLALVLLVSAGMLGRTLLRFSSLDPGLNVNNVLTARFAISPGALQDPQQIRSAWQNVLDGARRLPDVEFAALTDIIPMREGENSVPYRTASAPLPLNEAPLALASSVTPDYLKVMGIPLREGRFLDEHDRENSEPVVVIDENLVRHAFNGQSAVGRHLWIAAFGSTPVRIVGVVGHVRHWGLAGDDQSRVRDQIYYPLSQVPNRVLRFFSSIMSIAVRTKTQPLSVVGPLRLEMRGAAGDQALYAARTMEQLVKASLDRQRFLLILFSMFGGVALLLASIGIYGVLAYLTRQRVPEIGVRMALGATGRDIIVLVLRQCLHVVLLGLGVGVVAALAVGRALTRLVEGMKPVELSTFAIVIPLLLAAALAASYVPVRRASRIDPVRALRQE